MVPYIVPLARRLAEENNVDWRTLQGSGEDGAVRERDVLDLLQATLGQGSSAPRPLPSASTSGGVLTLPSATVQPAEAVDDRPLKDAAPVTMTPKAPPLAEPKKNSVLEEAHRAALSSVESLKAKVAELETVEQQHAAVHAQVARLQEDIRRRDREIGELRALVGEVAQLEETLADARRETQSIQTENGDLVARLSAAEADREEAEAENARLAALNASLEQEVAQLNRPWWKFWG